MNWLPWLVLNTLGVPGRAAPPRTSPSSAAINGPVQRANPAGGGRSKTARMRLPVSTPYFGAARMRPVGQARQALPRIAASPQADLRGIVSTFWRSTRRPPFSRQQHYPGAKHFSLFRCRRPYSHLEHRLILRRQPYFRSLGYHPNAESRIRCLRKVGTQIDQPHSEVVHQREQAWGSGNHQMGPMGHIFHRWPPTTDVYKSPLPFDLSQPALPILTTPRRLSGAAGGLAQTIPHRLDRRRGEWFFRPTCQQFRVLN